MFLRTVSFQTTSHGLKRSFTFRNLWLTLSRRKVETITLGTSGLLLPASHLPPAQLSPRCRVLGTVPGEAQPSATGQDADGDPRRSVSPERESDSSRM